MIELYVYSTTMSPGNQGVFQLLKEVTFRRILKHFSDWKPRKYKVGYATSTYSY